MAIGLGVAPLPVAPVELVVEPGSGGPLDPQHRPLAVPDVDAGEHGPPAHGRQATRRRHDHGQVEIGPRADPRRRPHVWLVRAEIDRPRGQPRVSRERHEPDAPRELELAAPARAAGEVEVERTGDRPPGARHGHREVREGRPNQGRDRPVPPLDRAVLDEDLPDLDAGGQRWPSRGGAGGGRRTPTRG
jgi:hypothetical protein